MLFMSHLQRLCLSAGMSLAWILSGCGGGGDASTEGVDPATLAYAPAPPDNPLKGFMPYAGTYDLPHSLEFFYLPLKDLQTGYTTFTWTPLDQRLAAIAGRGHQAVFRIYLDYPDQGYGVPAFLSGVPKRAYTDFGNGTHATSYSPDYGDADLQRATLNFIAALGTRYDGDPRIGFVQTGLLGFWGEWHTYPHPEWMASATFMDQVLDAFQTAFPHTLLLTREPKTGVDMDRPRLGFHDDSFAYQTLGPTDWHFWPKVTGAGLQDAWKTRPIGGEVRPEVQDCLWKETSCAPSGQGFDACVDGTHASWMLNQGAFEGLPESEKAKALAGARRLGYELHVSRVELGNPGLYGTVRLENRGVAPFYYPWTVHLGALDGSRKLTTWALPWDLRSLLPGTPVDARFEIPVPGLAPGTYTLLLGVPNPMPGGKPLRFANAAQDQDLDGWLTLGSFTVAP